jgi:manganese/iron transport system permease protein
LDGLAIAYLNRWNLLVGALLAALMTALGIGWLSRRRLQEDTAIGVLFSGMFALGDRFVEPGS